LDHRQSHRAHRTASTLSGQYGTRPGGPLHDIPRDQSHRRSARELTLG
jgi:hypothetical protein